MSPTYYWMAKCYLNNPHCIDHDYMLWKNNRECPDWRKVVARNNPSAQPPKPTLQDNNIDIL